MSLIENEEMYFLNNVISSPQVPTIFAETYVQKYGEQWLGQGGGGGGDGDGLIYISYAKV